MATFTQKKRVSFAHDNIDLMKPEPDTIAEYEINSPQLLLFIKTAKEIEEEIDIAFESLKTCSNAWKPKRKMVYDGINELVTQSKKMLMGVF